jgi:transposase-like protein
MKRCTAKPKAQAVTGVLKGKTTAADVARRHDLTPAEHERWTDDGMSGRQNSFRAHPRDIREQFERKGEAPRAASGEHERELKAPQDRLRLLDEDQNACRRCGRSWRRSTMRRHRARGVISPVCHRTARTAVRADASRYGTT